MKMFKLYVKFPQFGNDTCSKKNKIVDIEKIKCEKIWNNIGHELCVYVNHLFGCSFLYFYIQSDIFRICSSKMLMREIIFSVDFREMYFYGIDW